MSMLSDENRRKETAIAQTLEENRRLHAEKQELAASNTALQRQIAELNVRSRPRLCWCCVALHAPPSPPHPPLSHLPLANVCFTCCCSISLCLLEG